MTSWWRGPLIVAAMGVCLWGGNISLFAFIPMVVWCLQLARTQSVGLVVGLILLALETWFVAPQALWLSGPLAPAPLELFWLYAVLAAVVCMAGVLVERRRPAGFLTLLCMVVLAFVATAVLWFDRLEDKPKDEGVLPGPAGLQVVEGDGWCGSGNCSRDVDATGEGATDVMRAHLVSRGFTPAASLDGDERLCRKTGLVMTHEVCAELEDATSGSVRVSWYVN